MSRRERIAKTKKKSLAGRLLKLLLILLLIIILLLAATAAALTYLEYNPAEEEALDVTVPGSESENKVLEPGKPVTLLTWNIGYAALGANADFFMDCGTGVITAEEELVNSNLANITSQILYQHPDIILLQEVDTDAKRSYHLDEAKRILDNISGRYSTFAYNYRAAYVPYPWPTLGKIEAGLLTISSYPIESATRVQLPISFKWPVRTVNLKRCLAVHRIPVEGTDKELVLINLHLEAYDHGEGKIAQTEAMMSLLKSEVEKGNYVIAGGDFNQTFSCIDTSMYPLGTDVWQCGSIDTSTYDTEWQFVMDNQIPSCRSLDRPYEGADKDAFQYYLIDGYILSHNVEIMEISTKDLDFQFADHNPVVLKIKLSK